jgi:hypothetical protein
MFPSRLLAAHEEGRCAAGPSGSHNPPGGGIGGYNYPPGVDRSSSTSSAISSSSCSLARRAVQAALRFLHAECPSTYYQDDYVMSFLVNIGNVDVRSTYVTILCFACLRVIRIYQSIYLSICWCLPDCFLWEDMT